jgi:dTDP-L-rhamnose 4-epimerase
VFHFAALVGVGQSMYDIARYTAVNNVGTATLLEALCVHRVERLIVASSMSLYGEGLYRSASGVEVTTADRPDAQLRAGDWELRGADGAPLVPLPTPETKTPVLSSVYALSKFDQERLALMVGRAYGIPTVAVALLQCFRHTTGPLQSLHGRAGDLRVAAVEWPPAGALRRRPAAT